MYTNSQTILCKWASVVSPTAATFFYNFSEACRQTKRWKHVRWLSVSSMAANTQIVESDLALHQSLPDVRESSPEPSPQPCWTWPGSVPMPPRPSSKPSPDPCSTWPGSSSKPPRLWEPSTQSMISRTNTCNTARFKPPFARDNKHKKLCQFMWLYLTYLLFDSHSLRVKSAEETRFQV